MNVRVFLVAAATVVILCSSHALAQKPPAGQIPGPPNALQGFSQNRDEPVKIQADSLVMRDKDKMATFTGNVHVTQGDTELRSKVLVVYYEDDSAKTAKTDLHAAQPGPGGQQQIRRIDATGGVVVTQKDQNAAGDTGTFDMRSNTVTLSGNVVVTHGKDVMRGPRLVVDLTTGVSHMEGGRVEGLFQSSRSDPNGLPTPGGQGSPTPGLPFQPVPPPPQKPARIY